MSIFFIYNEMGRWPFRGMGIAKGETGMRESAMTQRRRWKAADGFSAIELIIVVAIMLVVAAVSLPGLFRYIRNYQINGAARELAGEIQRARGAAVMKNVRYGVIFLIVDARQYRFVIEDLQDDASKSASASVYLDPAKVSDLAGLYSSTDAAEQALLKAQFGPLRQLPAHVVFGNHCLGAAGDNPGLRFGGLGMMCKPAGTATPRTPGSCDALPTGAALASFGADGTATFCLADTGRGLARRVVVSAGGRTRVEEVAYAP
jgi:prepilin-type N-terminal cleavage/methylation domain-containing protein